MCVFCLYLLFLCEPHAVVMSELGATVMLLIVMSKLGAAVMLLIVLVLELVVAGTTTKLSVSELVFRISALGKVPSCYTGCCRLA